MKFFLFILCIVFAFSTLSSNQMSFSEYMLYAKIEKENVFMYKHPENNEKNKLFSLPSTYFVKLINEANDDFYYCYYKDLKGYVQKSDVCPMLGIPSKPYLEGLFRTFSLDGLGLYSSPYIQEKNLLSTIPYLTDDLIFYGSINGQEIIPDKTNEWYYCKYNFGEGICGYVYSVFCDKLPIETQNLETFDVITQPFYNSSSVKELSKTAMVFIVLGVAIPCLIVLFLLIKPTLIKESLNTTKSKLKTKRKRDYFEFDDSDLN